MATEYVDAGTAVENSSLSGIVGSAPPVTNDVTYERILNARSEPENWLTYYGAYDGQRYSPLDQSNRDTVKQLTPAWVFQAGSVGLHSGKSTYSFEASPLVVDGIMYVSGWDGWVWALDAQKGGILWQYRTASPFDVSLCCGNVNRGVAVAEGKVFVTTLAAHVIALDAETGKKVWDQTYGDVRAGESATVAPLVVKDMVIVGSSGGEFGVRGHADAFKRETGEHVWRCYMVPKPGEPATGASARATTCTRTPASPSTSTAARSSTISSTPRTTCGTTTPPWSTSCSTWTGRSWPPTSTRTGSSTSSTARTWTRSGWSRSSTASTGARSTR